MTPYRSGGAQSRVPPRAPWYRLARAWFNGTLRRAAERRFRLGVLADPMGSLERASDLSEAFRVAGICHARGIRIDGYIARQTVARCVDAAELTAEDVADIAGMERRVEESKKG